MQLRSPIVSTTATIASVLMDGDNDYVKVFVPAVSAVDRSPVYGSALPGTPVCGSPIYCSPVPGAPVCESPAQHCQVLPLLSSDSLVRTFPSKLLSTGVSLGDNDRAVEPSHMADYPCPVRFAADKRQTAINPDIFGYQGNVISSAHGSQNVSGFHKSIQLPSLGACPTCGTGLCFGDGGRGDVRNGDPRCVSSRAVNLKPETQQSRGPFSTMTPLSDAMPIRHRLTTVDAGIGCPSNCFGRLMCDGDRGAGKYAVARDVGVTQFSDCGSSRDTSSICWPRHGEMALWKQVEKPFDQDYGSLTRRSLAHSECVVSDSGFGNWTALIGQCTDSGFAHASDSWNRRGRHTSSMKDLPQYNTNYYLSHHSRPSEDVCDGSSHSASRVACSDSTTLDHIQTFFNGGEQFRRYDEDCSRVVNQSHQSPHHLLGEQGFVLHDGTPKTTSYFGTEDVSVEPAGGNAQIYGGDGTYRSGSLLGQDIHDGTHRSGSLLGQDIHDGTYRSGSLLGQDIHDGTHRSGSLLGQDIHDGTYRSGSLLGQDIHDGTYRSGSLPGQSIHGGTHRSGSLLGQDIHDGTYRSGSLLGQDIHDGTHRSGSLLGQDIHDGTYRSGSLMGQDIHDGTYRSGSLLGQDIHDGTYRSGSLLGQDIHDGTYRSGSLLGQDIHGGTYRSGSLLGQDIHDGTHRSGSLPGQSIHGGSLQHNDICWDYTRNGVSGNYLCGTRSECEVVPHPCRSAPHDAGRVSRRDSDSTGDCDVAQATRRMLQGVDRLVPSGCRRPYTSRQNINIGFAQPLRRGQSFIQGELSVFMMIFLITQLIVKISYLHVVVLLCKMGAAIYFIHSSVVFVST